ncbi:hypothetical protein LX99_02519 [Mucilaginibacter oryzae]|uniref:Uncharacterized protein n=1 Tax=Mucilaginibacter oryzae TaxID=468058 RepID=A0A316HRV6_9SPHI|nr:hypothetical protein [Mucilaginibacter oryzae]PWK77642.1 hypothetical protein LX99_02519 [Mucilaginibacter oryzae]
MNRFIKIQDSIFVEKCIVCGSRPVIQQAPGGKFIVRCKANADHYKTQPGLIDIDAWNKHNRKPDNGSDNIRHLKRG